MTGQLLQVAAWWLASSLIGWLAFPLVRRVFGRLPDSGYGFSRAIGLLALTYAVWLGATAGWVPNTRVGVFGLALVLAGTSVALSWRQRREILGWVRQNRQSLWVMEALFLAAFLGWAFVRANNPEITNTEKPMEMMFLNSILRSPTFPPHDGWLSGYAISYYYLGYIMMAVLTELTGAAPGVAFNLVNALWFALTALGSYAILYNLLNWRHQGDRPRRWAPLLAPVLVLIAGNLEAALEVLHSQYVFWRVGAGGQLVSSFWSGLNIKDLVDAPTGAPTWFPTRYLWWWRASRVLRDVNLAGVDLEVIDEFPFFSFLLADNHPHVLGLPFVVTAVGFAFRSMVTGEGKLYRMSRLGERWDPAPLLAPAAIGLGALVAFVRSVDLGTAGSSPLEVFKGVGVSLLIAAAGFGIVIFFTYWFLGRIPALLSLGEFVVACWLFGALAFLNIWDYPFYLTLLVLALLWRGGAKPGRPELAAAPFTGLALVLGGVLAYLPWYPTFSSQAGGLLPNLIFPTEIQHFVVMFAPAFVPLFVWIVWRATTAGHKLNWRRLGMITVGVPVVLLVLSWLLAVLVASVLKASGTGLETILTSMGAPGIRAGIEAVLKTRLSHPFTGLWLGLTLGLIVALLWPDDEPQESSRTRLPLSPPQLFVLLMAGVGALLVLGPEYFYLQDLFGYRMNTVFKFFYAAWIMWGVAGAYALVELWPGQRAGWAGWRVLVVVPLLLGLIYPALALWTKTDAFNPPGGRTLDGTAYMASTAAGDAAAIGWINQHLPDGVIAEAVGGSYTAYGRISAHTGLSTVIGWPFHEAQWRGGGGLLGSRETDIATLYSSRQPDEIMRIINQYHIDYIYIGDLEQAAYGVGPIDKYLSFMTVLYQDQGVTILGVTGKTDVP